MSRTALAAGQQLGNALPLLPDASALRLTLIVQILDLKTYSYDFAIVQTLNSYPLLSAQRAIPFSRQNLPHAKGRNPTKEGSTLTAGHQI